MRPISPYFLLCTWPMFICLAGTAPAADAPDENTSYTVSATGEYLFVTTNQVDPKTYESSAKVTVLAMDDPKDQALLGDFGSGKGVPHIACSPGDHWIFVNIYAAVHSIECQVFRHVSGPQFKEMDLPDLQPIYEKASTPGFGMEAVSGLYWKPDLSGLMLAVRGRGRKHDQGPLLLDFIDILYNLREKQFEIASGERFYPAFGEPDANDTRKDPKADQIAQMAAAIADASLDHQLNVIYNRLKPKLSASAQIALIAEEKQWLADRAKLPLESQSESTADRIKILAFRFLQQ